MLVCASRALSFSDRVTRTFSNWWIPCMSTLHFCPSVATQSVQEKRLRNESNSLRKFDYVADTLLETDGRDDVVSDLRNREHD